MEKYFKRKLVGHMSQTQEDNTSPLKQSHVEINLADLTPDPGLRTRIMDYNPNDRDQIR